MNLYWFTNEEGHYWQVVAAQDKNRAWELFAREQVDEEGGRVGLKEVKKKYHLEATTILGKEGEVASIFPLECGFTILAEPDGEVSSMQF